MRPSRSALLTGRHHFPNGPVTATPYAGETEIPLQPEPIYQREKGSDAEVIATYDAEFRAVFDRKITGWAIDFMRRSHAEGKPFYHLPATQVHIPPIRPEYAGKTKRGNTADLLVQMDDFTGQILDALDEPGSQATRSWCGRRTTGRIRTTGSPPATRIRLAASEGGFSGQWRGAYFTSLEGSNRAPCIIRWRPSSGRDK